MAAVAAAGAYLPRYCILAQEYRGVWGSFAARGITEKTVAGFDEDEVTMAVGAALSAIANVPGRPRTLGFVGFASAQGPATAGTLAEALGVEDAATADFLGSMNATGAAMLAAFNHVDREGTPALVVASDGLRAEPSSPEEHRLGCGAGAILFDREGPLVVEKTASLHREVVDRGRGATPDLLGGLMADAIGRLGRRSPAGGIATENDPRIPAAAFRGVAAEKILTGPVAFTGDTGAASLLLALVHRGNKLPKGRLVLATAGRGSATAVALRVQGPLPGGGPLADAKGAGRTPLTYTQYLQHRRYWSGPGPGVAQGAYVSLPVYLSEVKARYRLVGQRCTSCRRVQFPPRQTCKVCGGRTFRDASLSRTATIHSFTVIGRGAAPSEFADQQALVGEYVTAVVEFPEGPRVAAMLTDAPPNSVVIGNRVHAVFRRLYDQECVTRYGFKFAPA